MSEYIHGLVKKLKRHGNSKVLLIDRAICKMLNLTCETPLRLEIHDGKRLIVTPIREYEKGAPDAVSEQSS